MARFSSVKAQGLYDPAYEHDACGTGFVASIDGQVSHSIVKSAIQCVCNVTHRGAVAADAKTGDGAGVLFQIPHKLFAKYLASRDIPTPAQGDLAVGVIFLSKDPLEYAKAEGIVNGAIKGRRIQLLGWRDVPVDASVLGQQAKDCLPVVKQVLMARPESMPAEEFERHLLVVRRRIERAWDKANCENCYIPSFSSQTIVYKGMLVSTQLNTFYKDLADPDCESAIAVFHQRYSTNTFPNWFLAQPFRYASHNGEINTVKGNRNWMSAREPFLESAVWGDELHDLFPIIQPDGSDSMSLDNVFELLVMSGWHPFQAMLMLVPDAWQGMRGIDPKIKAFYQYHATLCESWDGPAALTFTDGKVVGASLDRNGLRPGRYWVTDDNVVIMASEVGVIDIPSHKIVEKGRLGPGQIFGVDTHSKRILHNEEIKTEFAALHPYAEWVKQGVVSLSDVGDMTQPDDLTIDANDLTRNQIAFGYNDEELGMVIEPMVKNSKEPIWSMGDDTPLSVLSTKSRPIFTYFKQLFAQVTNPPIDPIREELVMSLNGLLGARPSFLECQPAPHRMLMVPSPMLRRRDMHAIKTCTDEDLNVVTIPILFDVDKGDHELRRALKHVCEKAEHAVDDGATILILSDRGMDATKAAIPSLLATSAVHHALIRGKRRMRASIVVEAGDVHDVHQFACLVGYGASAVYPYVAIQTIDQMVSSGKFGDLSIEQAMANYHKAVDQGMLKIMSKMGISAIGSYRGAQIFEAIGVGEELIEDCFPGTPSRIGGISYEHIARDVMHWHESAFKQEAPLHLEAGGFYKYRRDGEYHAFNPENVRLLQQSVKNKDYDVYKKFSAAVDNRPPTALRDLLDVRPVGSPVRIEEVESVDAITRRFVTANISFGALSIESHETLAIAMNIVGGRSGSGEGGEDPDRYRNVDPDRDRNSKIKQVASGRFGVTPEYLMSAEQIEIKMAQGAKPGEGGQLPGHKVSVEIARVRHTVPGVTLISPPPHHDIYSIEDLAQLIYDLKMINPKAKVIVKLVSEAGVGTIAAGVAKGYADVILIAGYDGGTGASPLSSIKNAGLPWELGLAETQQTLRLNGLRKRVTLRTDGGMKNARDLVMAAVFGAEEYGFGTAPLVATGCMMTRKCHLNTCPVGIATQDQKLRDRYFGTVDMMVNYMRFVAQEVREQMAALGVRTLDELIGRTDLLTPKSLENASDKIKTIDLDFLMTAIDVGSRISTQDRNDRDDDDVLDDRLLKDASAALEGRGKVTLDYPIRNIHRTVGARLAGFIAQKYTNEGLPEGSIDVTFNGVAGQSFGAFCIKGMRLTLKGEANDYVGKGINGGELIIAPANDAPFKWHENSIIGNTCLYGATGGTLYAAGSAGERFAVRNSGASAVVEGVGDHACEYMTGGNIVILGPTGRNFGAGMTGGKAFIYDPEGAFEPKINPELVVAIRLHEKLDADTVRTLIERHYMATKSPLAFELFSNWEDKQKDFWLVLPREAQTARLEKAVSAKEG